MLLYLILVVPCGGATSQALQLSMDTVYGCPGDTIEVPITMQNFNNIGAITLFIGYNDSELSYDTTIALNPMLPGLLVNQITSGNAAVGFSWFTTSMNGINIGNGVLGKMRFVALSGISSLLFSIQCEVANGVGQLLSVQYTDGKLLPREPEILQHPSDTMVKAGADAQFSVMSSGSGVTLQWYCQENTTGWVELTDSGSYSGSQTSLLSVHLVNALQHGWQYRCLVTEGNCSGFSNPATLLVDTIDAVPERLSIYSSPPPYPNPFHHTLLIPVSGHLGVTYTIALSDPLGRIIFSEFHSSGIKDTNLITLDDLHITPGCYTLTVIAESEEGNDTAQSFTVIAK